MKDDLVGLHAHSGRRFAELVAAVAPGQWQAGTPCSEWDVRQLVQHVLYEQRWVPPLFEGLTTEQVGDQFDGDLLGEEVSDWPGVLASSIEAGQAAVARPGSLEQTVHLSYGDVPGREYVMQLTADLGIHAWDLASATGQDGTLDPDLVALLLPWTQASAELLAESGMFGRPVDVGADAADDVRLLGLLGRHA